MLFNKYLYKQASEDNAMKGSAARIYGRSLAEGIAGSGIGAGIGAGVSALAGKYRPLGKITRNLSKMTRIGNIGAPGMFTPNRVGALTGGLVGTLPGGVIGGVHGVKKSLDNQIREHIKASALRDLMGQGYDFDTAVDLVKQAEYDVYGD